MLICLIYLRKKTGLLIFKHNSDPACGNHCSKNIMVFDSLSISVLIFHIISLINRPWCDYINHTQLQTTPPSPTLTPPPLPHLPSSLLQRWVTVAAASARSPPPAPPSPIRVPHPTPFLHPQRVFKGRLPPTCHSLGADAVRGGRGRGRRGEEVIEITSFYCYFSYICSGSEKWERERRGS